MDSSRPSNPNYLTLKQAAESLAVSVDVLLSWNENNILKPTITPSGEVGYTKDQIDQFLEIRNNSQLAVRENSLQNTHNFSPQDVNPFNNVGPINSVNIKNQPTNNFSQINNYNFYTPPTDLPRKNKSLFSIIGVFSSFSVIIIAIFIILLSQENKLNSILFQNDKASNNEASTLTSENQISKLNSIDERNKITQNSFNNDGNSLSQNKDNVLDKAFEDKKGTVSASITKTYKDHVAMLSSIVGGEAEANSIPGQASEVSTYSQKTNSNDPSDLPLDPKNIDTEKEVFDTEGNIKVSKTEEDENRLIATRLAMGGINQNHVPLKQNTNSITLVSFLILGGFAFYVLYSRKRQLFPSLEQYQNLDIQPQKISSVSENPKLIEVFQKTDGTVALIFQGKEFRISKPELDSESDKFIDRLMQLVGPNIKEIEYDSLQDDELLINTPLSKLVTRLGFVGIKRDLFFPRTSKSRVHFRKYLTAGDLMSMNVTADDITNGFLINN